MVKFCSLQQLSLRGDTGAELEHKSCSSLAGMDLPLAQLPSPQRLTGMFTQGSSENQLRFVCTFSPRSDSLRRSDHEEYNDDTHSESVSVVVPAQCSVYQLRLRICMQVGASPLPPCHSNIPIQEPSNLYRCTVLCSTITFPATLYKHFPIFHPLTILAFWTENYSQKK